MQFHSHPVKQAEKKRATKILIIIALEYLCQLCVIIFHKIVMMYSKNFILVI